MRFIFLITLLSIALLACKDDENPTDDLAAMQQSQIETFIADNELEATRNDAGFYFIVEQENSGGTQAQGNILSIYYSMSILDGQEISFFQADNGDPLRLNQGANAVVPVGLDAGLALMREGEIYRFILPSSLAFDDLEFSTLIPANSIIDVQVELVRVESENDILNEELADIENYREVNLLDSLELNPTDSVLVLNSGLRYKRIAEGDSTSPGNGSLVSITYTGTFLDDSQFDRTTGSQTFDFSLGIGEVINGLDEGVGLMENGERALLIMPSNLAYGESVRVIPDFLIDQMIERRVVPDYVSRIPPYSVLIFDVTLQ